MTGQEARDDEREALARLEAVLKRYLSPHAIAEVRHDLGADFAAGCRKHPEPEITDEMVARPVYDAVVREYAEYRRDRQEQMGRIRAALDDAYRGARTGNLLTPYWVVRSIDDARTAGGWTIQPAALRVPVGEGETDGTR